MSEGMWIALIAASGTFLTALVSLLVAVINIIVNQSKSTITELASERDYWKDLAMGYRSDLDPKGGDG